MRAGLSVFVRDFTVHSIISDMMMGVPAVYACFAGYDEVAHHSGLERADTMEVLRKLDQQFGRIERARKYAARPYELVVLSDHGQTQGATFLQRNGYGLDELVERNLRGTGVENLRGGDENDSAVVQGGARGDRTQAEGRGQAPGRRPQSDRHGVGQPRAHLPHGRAATDDDGGDRRAAPRPAGGAARPSARRLAARPLRRARRRGAGRRRRQLPERRPRGGRGPAGRVLAHGRGPPAAHRRLRPRRRRHGQQLLRRAARRGLRVRGAHLVPRRHGRPADAAVPAAPGGAGRPCRGRSSAPRRRTGCWPAGAANCRAARRQLPRPPPAARLRRPKRPPRRRDGPGADDAPEAATAQLRHRGPLHDRVVRLRSRLLLRLRSRCGADGRRGHLLRLLDLLHQRLVLAARPEPDAGRRGDRDGVRRGAAARALPGVAAARQGLAGRGQPVPRHTVLQRHDLLGDHHRRFKQPLRQGRVAAGLLRVGPVSGLERVRPPCRRAVFSRGDRARPPGGSRGST